ncbi:hypothetical protein D3C85_1393080 [compost metagenome]
MIGDIGLLPGWVFYFPAKVNLFIIENPDGLIPAFDDLTLISWFIQQVFPFCRPVQFLRSNFTIIDTACNRFRIPIADYFKYQSHIRCNRNRRCTLDF